jgi:hypothetical protein
MPADGTSAAGSGGTSARPDVAALLTGYLIAFFRKNARSKPPASQAAFGPHKALDRSGEHKKMGLIVRCKVLHDLLTRDSGPCIVQPSVPDILRIPAAADFDFELCFHDVGGAAAVERFVIELPLRMQVIVGALEILKPLLMRTIRPVAVRASCRRNQKG